MEQYLFKEKETFYLVEVSSNGVKLKIKNQGWSDTWSAPLKIVEREVYSK